MALRVVTESVHAILQRLPYPFRLYYQLWLADRRMSPARREAIERDRAVLKKLPASDVILGGPFTGLKYPSISHGSALLPKIVGTYERELHPAIEQICSCRSDLIVDIGAAEGYYAVGLARRCGVPVVAFEMHERARVLLDHMARRNGVSDKVEIRGECTPLELAAVLRSAARPVVVCDCEGAEALLMDPQTADGLVRSVVLVEIHETASPGIAALLHARFAPTHRISSIQPIQVTGDEHKLLSSLDAADRARAVDERRGDATSWLFMTPDTSGT